MIADRNAGRRADDAAVKIEVTKVLSRKSTELQKLLDEVNKGHTVMVSRVSSAEALRAKVDAIQTEQKLRGMSGTDIVTALSGGAALGMASLALAPASVIVAAVATIIGVALGGAAKRLDHPRAHSNETEITPHR